MTALYFAGLATGAILTLCALFLFARLWAWREERRAEREWADMSRKGS